MKTLACLFVSFIFSASAWAIGPSLTYHGRIIKADGTPVLATAVLFKIQFRSPGAENCLMYEESLTQNLATSNGAFAISLNSGAGTRTDTSGYSLEKVFSNRTAFSFPGGTCSSGTTYTPAATDGRTLLVYFNDGTFAGWEPVPQQAVNLVPQAIEALQVGGFSANSLLRVANGVGPQTVAALTPADFTDLLAIIGGTSTKYMQTAGGTQSPVLTTPPTTPVAGQIWFDPADSTFKYYDGTTTTPVSGGAGGGTGTVDVAHGGTGATTLAANRLLMGNGTTAVSSLAAGTSGQILRSAGAASPAWTTATFPSTVTDKALLFGSSTNIVGEVTVPANPSVLLSTTITGAPQWSGGSANTFLKGSASGVSFSAIDLATADVTGTLPVSKGGTGATSLTGTFVMVDGQDGALTLGTNNANSLTLETNGAAAITIDSSGRVGIGTATPTGLLHISGTKSMTPSSTVGSHFTESAVLQNDNATAASGTASTATFHYFGTPTLTASNTTVTTTNANGISIASAPWAGTNQTITNTTALNIAGGAVNSVGTVANSYGLKVAANSGATKNYAATFSGGNVGIGTTTPSSTLDVNGQVKGGFVSHASLNTDWATGNIQSTSVAAGTLTFTAGSMFDGANYTLIVTGAGNYVLGTNADIATWRCLPACPSNTITASGHTILTIIKAGTTGYVSWLAGF